MNTETEILLGWHFVGATLRDGSAIPKNGVWLPKIDDIKLCDRGYRGSIDPFDALQYAPGSVLCRCEYRGRIIHDTDKFVAQQRRIINRVDATEMLNYFARMQAVSVAHLWEPDQVVLDWLMTGDESLRAAAWDAARDAAWDAAWDAARDAARAAARATARATARAAAWATAWDAARAAARDPAWDAARAAARENFAELVNEMICED